MSKPVIFTLSAAWDEEASVWSGHCDAIPAAAGAPTLDEPTHVSLTPEGDALVVANSGWSRFSEAGAPREETRLEAGRVLRIPLPRSREP